MIILIPLAIVGTVLMIKSLLKYGNVIDINKGEKPKSWFNFGVGVVASLLAMLSCIIILGLVLLSDKMLDIHHSKMTYNCVILAVYTLAVFLGTNEFKNETEEIEQQRMDEEFRGLK